MLDALPAKTITRICLGVCTFRRPKMLKDCLESLMLQIRPNDVEVEIVVVDNEPWSSNRDIVNMLRLRSPHLLRYMHEPRQGIAVARNRVIDAALNHHCDWIAFIDDDEVADPFWLSELMAREYRETPVLVGNVEYVYPTPLPFWAVPKTPRAKPEGHREKTAAAGNVRFSMELVRAGKLRFNEELGLMGGEDVEFFAAAHKLGYEIRSTLGALTWETFHRERLSYSAQMHRAYWCAVSDMRTLAIGRGWPAVVLRKAHTIPLGIVFGVAEIAVSPLFAVISLTAFKRRALAGGKKIAKGIGRAVAITGHLPQPYARVHGV